MRKMSMQYLHKYGESIQAMTQQIKTGDKWATSHKSCFPAYGAWLINPGYGFSSGKLVRTKAKPFGGLFSIDIVISVRELSQITFAFRSG